MIASAALAILLWLGLLASLRETGILFFSPRDSVLVTTDFENRGQVILDLMKRYGQRSRSALEQSRRANVFPSIRVGSILQPMGKPAAERVTPGSGTRDLPAREYSAG